MATENQLNDNAISVLCTMWKFQQRCKNSNSKNTKLENFTIANVIESDILHAYKMYILGEAKDIPPEHKIGIWTILYASRFLSLSPSPYTKNSANCSFTISKGTTINNTSIEHCVKIVPCQIAADKDFIGLDNINGFVMNQIAAKDPLISRHVMTYVDSFWTYTKTEWDPMAVANATADILTNTTNTLPYKPDEDDVYVNITKAIPGTALKDLKHSKDFFKILIKEFPPLFHALKRLGIKYGFIHNDLHLGNIMIDSTTQEFKIIDYGRCVFDLTAHQEIHEATNKFITADVWKNFFQWIIGKTSRDYHSMITHLCDMNVPTATYRAENNVNTTGALDLAMLCGNVTRDVLILCDMNKNIDWISQIEAVITKIFKFGSIHSVILPQAEHHHVAYSEAKTLNDTYFSSDPNIHAFLESLLEGLYYLRIYLLSIIPQVDLPQVNTAGNIQIPTETMRNHGIYTCFQYSGDEIDKFWEAVKLQPQASGGDVNMSRANAIVQKITNAQGQQSQNMAEVVKQIHTKGTKNIYDIDAIPWTSSNPMPQNMAEILNRNYVSSLDRAPRRDVMRAFVPEDAPDLSA